MTHTHTIAELEVGDIVFREVEQKLRDAGYDHVFLDGDVIDMSGIGLTRSKSSISDKTTIQPIESPRVAMLRELVAKLRTGGDIHGITNLTYELSCLADEIEANPVPSSGRLVRAEHQAGRTGLTAAYAQAINAVRDEIGAKNREIFADLRALRIRVEQLEARTIGGRWRRLIAWWRGFVERANRIGDVFDVEWVDVDGSESADHLPPVERQLLPVPHEDLPKVAALRRALLLAGQSPHGLRATPSDLARFELSRWDGALCGITCIDSPIISEGER